MCNTRGSATVVADVPEAGHLQAGSVRVGAIHDACSRQLLQAQGLSVSVSLRIGSTACAKDVGETRRWRVQVTVVRYRGVAMALVGARLDYQMRSVLVPQTCMMHAHQLALSVSAFSPWRLPSSSFSTSRPVHARLTTGSRCYRYSRQCSSCGCYGSASPADIRRAGEANILRSGPGRELHSNYQQRHACTRQAPVSRSPSDILVCFRRSRRAHAVRKSSSPRRPTTRCSLPGLAPSPTRLARRCSFPTSRTFRRPLPGRSPRF